jgi:hypothetical protein
MSTLRGQILFMMSLRVGQGEKGLVKPQKVTIQEIIADIGAILNKINIVLNDHEQRLQSIEELDLKAELETLRNRILAISDKKKQAEALQVFKSLCDLLGIADLEQDKPSV